ncbi:MAG: GNAT family N-acetyltransferase [Methylococcaceae bacterium]
MNKAFNQTTIELINCQLIKTITLDDAILLSTLLASSNPWLILNISASALENYFMRNDLALHRYLIIIEQQMAGIICIRNPWLRGPYIELLGLAPQYRNLGIGKQVLTWAETQARLEAKNLWVVTSAFNDKALSFYQNQGFQIVGSLPQLIRPEHDEILLRKYWD